MCKPSSQIRVRAPYTKDSAEGTVVGSPPRSFGVQLHAKGVERVLDRLVVERRRVGRKRAQMLRVGRPHTNKVAQCHVPAGSLTKLGHELNAKRVERVLHGLVVERGCLPLGKRAQIGSDGADSEHTPQRAVAGGPRRLFRGGFRAEGVERGLDRLVVERRGSVGVHEKPEIGSGVGGAQYGGD